MLLLPLENMLWKAKTTILFPFAIFGLVSGREVLHLSRIVLTLLGMFATRLWRLQMLPTGYENMYYWWFSSVFVNIRSWTPQVMLWVPWGAPQSGLRVILLAKSRCLFGRLSVNRGELHRYLALTRKRISKEIPMFLHCSCIAFFAVFCVQTRVPFRLRNWISSVLVSVGNRRSRIFCLIKVWLNQASLNTNHLNSSFWNQKYVVDFFRWCFGYILMRGKLVNLI